MIRTGKYLLALCLIVALFGGSGCSLNKNNKEVDRMMSCMEEKYGEEFQFVKWGRKSLGEKADAAYFKCSAMPDILIKGEWFENDEGEFVAYDNYMGYKLQDQIKGKIKEITKKVYPECVVIYHPEFSLFSPDVRADMELQEMTQTKGTLLSVEIIVDHGGNQDDRDQKLQQWREEAEGAALRMKGVLYAVKDPSILERLNEANYASSFSQSEDWYDVACHFAMDNAFEFYYISWR